MFLKHAIRSSPILALVTLGIQLQTKWEGESKMQTSTSSYRLDKEVQMQVTTCTKRNWANLESWELLLYLRHCIQTLVEVTKYSVSRRKIATSSLVRLVLPPFHITSPVTVPRPILSSLRHRLHPSLPFW
jgi:hypothetical protein